MAGCAITRSRLSEDYVAHLNPNYYSVVYPPEEIQGSSQISAVSHTPSTTMSKLVASVGSCSCRKDGRSMDSVESVVSLSASMRCNLDEVRRGNVTIVEECFLNAVRSCFVIFACKQSCTTL